MLKRVGDRKAVHCGAKLTAVGRTAKAATQALRRNVIAVILAERKTIERGTLNASVLFVMRCAMENGS
jgi:hypothetical protein